MSQVAGAIFLLIGCSFFLLSALGAVRLPDLFTRMSAITKAGTAGVGFLMLAVVCFYGDWGTFVRAVGVLFFVGLTAPVSVHMISRAAYLAGVQLWEGTFEDQLSTYYEERERARRAEEEAEG